MKYLGITLGGKGRDIFKYERESLVERAQRKATVIKSYIKKSYDITSVGKVVWKLQAISALLFGKQVVTLSKKLIDKIQKIENNMYRYLIGVGGTTPVATLRGEVEASSIESRIMETVLNFTRDTLQGRFIDVKSYMEHDLETGKGRWSRTVQKYRQELGIRHNDLKEISKKEIKNKVKERDTRLWEENIEEKVTLKWYKRERDKERERKG